MGREREHKGGGGKEKKGHEESKKHRREKRICNKEGTKGIKRERRIRRRKEI